MSAERQRDTYGLSWKSRIEEDRAYKRWLDEQPTVVPTRIHEMDWDQVQARKSEVSRCWNGGWECRSEWAQLKQREAHLAKDMPLVRGNRDSMKAYLARRQEEDRARRPGGGYTRHGGGVSSKPQAGRRRWAAS